MIQPPLGKPWLLYIILGSSLALNLVMVMDRPASDEQGVEDSEAADAVTADSSTKSAQAVEGSSEAPLASSVTETEDAAVQGLAAANLPDGWQLTKGVVERSLAHTFRASLGKPGDAVSAAYSRLFWWDMDLRRDLQPGDQVEVLWRPSDESVVEVLAARLYSRKLGGTLEAWKWQPPGEQFATYWDAEGRSVERRLRGGPIAAYEQITALLKDRPSHKGMDFKAPVGTPVMAMGNGLVTRTNWNHAANGNCVEIQLDDGHIAKLLHLSENRIEAGQRVTAGQVIALSGNTGHSTAPHLHYELHKGDKVVDPLDYHALDRLQLTGSNLDAFAAERARLGAMLDQSVASR